MDTYPTLAEHRRLLAALDEQAKLAAAIETASARIAEGFSTEAAAQDETRIRLVRLRTWGNA